MPSAEAQAVDQVFRDLTDEEVAHYNAKGWVFLKGFLRHEVAEQVLRRAQQRMGVDGTGLAENSLVGTTDNLEADFVGRLWQTWLRPSDDDDWLSSVSHSVGLGRAASRLLGDRDTRLFGEALNCKLPAQQAGLGTPWHQDFPYLPLDRTGSPTFWIALCDIPPEKGSMRFLSGSHAEGPLGRFTHAGIDAADELPWLWESYEESPPLHLRIGDATVHDKAIFHAAPENATDEPRWNYNLSVIPADALYTGAPFGATDGLGLEVNKPFDHPKLPLLPR